MENIIQGSHLGTWQWNVETGETVFNERWAQIAGYSLAELQPVSIDTWTKLCHPGDYRLARATLAQHFMGELDHYEVELRLRHKDGHWVWVAAKGRVASWTPEHRPLWMFGTHADITELKFAERSLASAVERLALATKAAGMGIWDWDLHSGQLVCDDQMHRLYGTRRGDQSEVLESWRASVHPQDRGRIQAETEAAVAGAKDYDTEFRVRHPDGQVRHIKAEGVVVRDADGLAVRMIGVAHDVTPQRQQDQDRAQLENQLAQSQRLESIGRLAGGVAHDFNNMLGVILARAEMAMEELDPAHPLYESLAEIERTADRSANLTRQLLAFARKQTIDPRVLDLNQAVDGLYKMLSRLIDESVVLAWRPDPGAWPVRMDPTQVDQILANLCVNARDAIRGPGRISIQTGNATLSQEDCARNPDCRPGDYAWLSVADDGSGMDAQTLAHLFEPFFTTKAVGKGTGLGLATVHGIVHQNHGFIQVDSAPGQGSTFRIYLPRHHGEGAPAAVAAPQRPGPTGETVLVVEDEPAMLRMAIQMLRSLGYEVLSAPSPAQALDLARRHNAPIHLLLTDVVMPGMNGRELADAVLAWHPRLRRVYMSGYTQDILAPNGVLEGSVHFLNKPFTKQALAEKLREALEE
ncbi:MAG TPA: PAS domain-containing protein [bacterium]|nr:PAS domain-containing protein [bacterium]